MTLSHEINISNENITTHFISKSVVYASHLLEYNQRGRDRNTENYTTVLRSNETKISQDWVLFQFKSARHNTRIWQQKMRAREYNKTANQHYKNCVRGIKNFSNNIHHDPVQKCPPWLKFTNVWKAICGWGHNTLVEDEEKHKSFTCTHLQCYDKRRLRLRTCFVSRNTTENSIDFSFKL